MKSAEKKEMQATAVEAAKAAGAIMSRNHFAAKKINESTQRDIKLELDVKCQQKIESMLTRAHPEVAILGVSRSDTKPVWDGNAFQPRLVLPLSFSYDHRVIDGADAARFTTYLSGLLGDMRRALL